MQEYKELLDSLNRIAEAIDRMAESNLLLIQTLAWDEEEDDPKPEYYMDGSPCR